MTTVETQRGNPYVGPRSFRKGERLFGRDVEIQRLVDLLIAERIVLLYSPSGAGKTSLIQAGLIRRLEEEDFTVLPGDAQVPVIRVNQEPTAEECAAGVANRYAFSALRCLERSLPSVHSVPLVELATMTLLQFLERRVGLVGASDAEVLIFDQFEEILNVEPNDRAGKEAFFDQVGAALRDRGRWAIFSMREDYIAALDPYLRRIPRRLATRFRLDLLGRDAAVQAIQGPADQLGVAITDAAAGKLVRDLSGVRVQRPDGTVATQEGPYVEPVQLQVVCFRLWEGHAGADRITEEEVGSLVGDVDSALAGYYADCVAATARETGVGERAIRDWAEGQLITDQGIRGQVLRGPEASGGLNNRVIGAMINAHVVRAEERRGATWFELAHDRLIEPVRKDNASWRERALNPTQRRALLWGKGGRSDGLLLRDQELADAERWAAGSAQALTSLEQEFLDACRDARADAERERERAEERQLLARKVASERQRRRVILGLLVILTITLFLGGIAVTQWFRAEKQRREAVRLAGIADVERGTAEEQGKIAKKQRILAEEQYLRAERLSALLNMERGLTYCAQGQVDLGMLCLARSLQTMQSRDADLQRAIRTQLSCWRQHLHVLKERLSHQGPVPAVAFSPDGKAILTCSVGKARLWDATTGQTIGPPLLHRGPVQAVAFSPDGKTVLTGSLDTTAQLWDAATGQPIGPPLQHKGPVMTVAFSPDGQAVLTGSYDGTARLWEAATGQTIGPPLLHQGRVAAVAFSPDGRTVLTGSADKTARLWEAATGQPIGLPLQHQGQVTDMAFSPDGQAVLTGSSDNTARLWDAATGQPVGSPLQHRDLVQAVAFSPDGQAVLTGCWDKTARLWDAATGQPIGPPLQHQGWVQAVAFSPDGTRVLTGSADKTARLWDAATGRPIGPPLQHKTTVDAVAFSPDGKIALTGSADFTARLWDVATGQPIGPPLQHQGSVAAVAFSPDGTRVLTGSNDKTARLWDAATGRPVGSPLQHRDWVNAVAFSPDGKTVLTGSDDTTARLWDVATGQPIGPPLQHQGRVAAVAFSPDGTRVLTGSLDRTAQLWVIPAPLDGEPDRIVLWTQMLTGQELDERGGIRFLDDPTWRQYRQELKRLGGPPP